MLYDINSRMPAIKYGVTTKREIKTVKTNTFIGWNGIIKITFGKNKGYKNEKKGK